jgi:hypothetical protein
MGEITYFVLPRAVTTTKRLGLWCNIAPFFGKAAWMKPLVQSSRDGIIGAFFLSQRTLLVKHRKKMRKKDATALEYTGLQKQKYIVYSIYFRSPLNFYGICCLRPAKMQVELRKHETTGRSISKDVC